MENVQYYSPTELILNPQAHKQTGELVKKYSDKVLIVLGGDFIKSSTWYSELIDSLRDNNIFYYELSGISPNPDLDKVYEGINKARENEIGFILSVGGGSAIDTAKSIAAGVQLDGDVWDLFIGKRQVEQTLPVGTIMTIMSTGSEGSNGAVISNYETNEKFDVMSDKLRPVFCLMNPAITYTLPEHQVWAGITDMFSHALERYLSPSVGTTLTDKLGEAILNTVIHEAEILKKDFLNYAARANLMIASILAHNNLTGLDRRQEWSTHIIAAPLSGYYGKTHGDTISVIYPQWAEYVYKSNPIPFKKLALNVWGIEDVGTDTEIAKKGIEKTTEFFDLMKMPLSLKALNIETDEKFEIMADSSLHNGEFGTILHLKKGDIIQIYRNSIE